MRCLRHQIAQFGERPRGRVAPADQHDEQVRLHDRVRRQLDVQRREEGLAEASRIERFAQERTSAPAGAGDARLATNSRSDPIDNLVATPVARDPRVVLVTELAFGAVASAAHVCCGILARHNSTCRERRTGVARADQSWRKGMGIEPTVDDSGRRPLVLKTREDTSPRPLPQLATRSGARKNPASRRSLRVSMPRAVKNGAARIPRALRGGTPPGSSRRRRSCRASSRPG